MENELLDQAIASYRANDLILARSLLEVEVCRHADNDEAWLWLSRVAAQPEERLNCLRRALAINPQNRLALSSLLLAGGQTASPHPVRNDPRQSIALATAVVAPEASKRVSGRSKWPGRARKLVRLAFFATSSLLFVLIAAATAPMFAGNRTLALMGGSMEPAIHVGSAVVARPVPSQELQVGDMIVFSPGSQGALPLVHRIVAIHDRDGTRYYTTRGDANKSSDVAEISLPPTAWRVWYAVPWAGYVISFASSGTGTLVLVVLPFATLVLTSVADWLRHQIRSRALWPGARRVAAG